jgi:hypothetical protein
LRLAVHALGLTILKGCLAMRLGSAVTYLAAIAIVAGVGCQVPARETEQRDVEMQPFSATSIWNTPLGRGAQFQSREDPETAMLRSDNIGGHAKSYAWIQRDAFGVYRAKKSDPLVRWTFQARSATAPWPAGGPIRNGSISLYTPKNIQFLGGGTDGHAVIIAPEGDVAYEIFHGALAPSGDGYVAKYLVRTDLRGTGIASGDHRSEGIRAFGGSLLGGLIRCKELEAGSIPHAIAMLLSPSQQRVGKTMDDQKVWPASVTDGGGRNNYSGAVPMGALIGIPQDVDLTKLGLTKSGLALARAYQNFGGYVVDTATNTMVLGVVEAGCDKPLVGALHHDKLIIRKHLYLITNNGPNTVGGPGIRVASRPPGVGG